MIENKGIELNNFCVGRVDYYKAVSSSNIVSIANNAKGLEELLAGLDSLDQM